MNEHPASRWTFRYPQVDTADFHVESIDLIGNRVEAEVGVAFVIACYSILRCKLNNCALSGNWAYNGDYTAGGGALNSACCQRAWKNR